MTGEWVSTAGAESVQFSGGPSWFYLSLSDRVSILLADL